MSHPWLEYKKWAVVGASDKTHRYGYKIYKKLKEAAYEVYPVSPKHEEIEGDKVYASLLDIEGEIDVVDFVVNPKIGMKVIEACKQKGIRRIVLQPGTVSDELLEKAADYGIEAIEGCVLVMLAWK